LYLELKMRYRPNQPDVRSTTQRRGSATNPAASAARVTIATVQPLVSLANAATCPRYPPSAQIDAKCGNRPASFAKTAYAPRMDDNREDQPQGVDGHVSLAPLDLIATIVPAKPSFSVVFTDWLSMIAADGVGSRPDFTRTCSRKASCIVCQVPVRRQIR
jgi:hypothetical protein